MSSIATTSSAGADLIEGRPPSDYEDQITKGCEWAERVVDAWDPCILTLDGGGTRSYSSLLILRALMAEIFQWEVQLNREEGKVTGDELRAQEDLLPCHYFDFVYGTGTGGLIAIMLGRLRMKVDDCLETFPKICDALFGHPRIHIPFRAKYRHEPLEEIMQEIVKQHCVQHEHCNGVDDLHPWILDKDVVRRDGESEPWDPNNPRVCQTSCLTSFHYKDVIVSHLLRSYPHFYTGATPIWITQYNEGANALTIWQTARATSAAPLYFKGLELDLDGDTILFRDGGLKENNASGAAYSEFSSLYSSTTTHDPAVLLSIGTSASFSSVSYWPRSIRRVPLLTRLIRILKRYSVIPTAEIRFADSERQHQAIRQVARGEDSYYKRLDVMIGLERMPYDDWIKGFFNPPSLPGGGIGTREAGSKSKVVPGGGSLTKITEMTEKYLNEPSGAYAFPGKKLRDTAEKLVRQRRARAELGGGRWETFVGNYMSL